MEAFSGAKACDRSLCKHACCHYLRLDHHLAERLLAAAAQEPDAKKRVNLIAEAFARLAG